MLATAIIVVSRRLALPNPTIKSLSGTVVVLGLYGMLCQPPRDHRTPPTCRSRPCVCRTGHRIRWLGAIQNGLLTIRGYLIQRLLLKQWARRLGVLFPGDDRYGERPDERVARVGSEVVHGFQEELDLERMVYLQVAEQSRVGRAEKYLAALILMPTEQDSATHLLNSRRLAGSLAKHIYRRVGTFPQEGLKG